MTGTSDAAGLSEDSKLSRWGMRQDMAMAIREADAQGFGHVAVYWQDKGVMVEGDGEGRIPIDVLAEVLRRAGYELRKVGA